MSLNKDLSFNDQKSKNIDLIEERKNIQDDYAYRKLRRDNKNKIKPSTTNLSFNDSIDCQSNLLPSQIKAREKLLKEKNLKNRTEPVREEKDFIKTSEKQKSCREQKTIEKVEISHEIVARRYPDETKEYYDFSKSTQRQDSNVNTSQNRKTLEPFKLLAEKIEKKSSKGSKDKATNENVVRKNIEDIKTLKPFTQQRSNSLPSHKSISILKSIKKLSSNPNLAENVILDKAAFKVDHKVKMNTNI